MAHGDLSYFKGYNLTSQPTTYGGSETALFFFLGEKNEVMDLSSTAVMKTICMDFTGQGSSVTIPGCSFCRKKKVVFSAPPPPPAFFSF